MYKKDTTNLETPATDNPKCIVDRELAPWAGDQTDVELQAQSQENVTAFQ